MEDPPAATGVKNKMVIHDLDGLMYLILGNLYLVSVHEWDVQTEKFLFILDGTIWCNNDKPSDLGGIWALVPDTLN